MSVLTTMLCRSLWNNHRPRFNRQFVSILSKRIEEAVEEMLAGVWREMHFRISKKRITVRQFSRTPVEEEKIQQLLVLANIESGVRRVTSAERLKKLPLDCHCCGGPVLLRLADGAGRLYEKRTLSGCVFSIMKSAAGVRKG